MLFEVGLCVATYLTVLFIEFSVAPMEWLSQKFPLAFMVPQMGYSCNDSSDNIWRHSFDPASVIAGFTLPDRS